MRKKILAYWSGTAGEFRKLTFKEWAIKAQANAAIINSTPVWKKLHVKHE